MAVGRLKKRLVRNIRDTMVTKAKGIIVLLSFLSK